MLPEPDVACSTSTAATSATLAFAWCNAVRHRTKPASARGETIAEKLRLATVTRGPNTPKFYQSKMLSAASQDFGPLEFVVLPLKLPGDFEGILGGNFFERHVVCLDYQRREIRVR
jgi:hypothetical protein